MIPDVARDGEEGRRQVDHRAAKHNTRGDVVLVGVGPDDQRPSALARRLEHAQSRRIGVLEDHVGPWDICASACSLPALTSSQLPT